MITAYYTRHQERSLYPAIIERMNSFLKKNDKENYVGGEWMNVIFDNDGTWIECVPMTTDIIGRISITLNDSRLHIDQWIEMQEW